MSQPRAVVRSSALRRYPALVWLIGAGLLALLLPSGLTLPQSGPSTLAEYAPVPGAGDRSADLGELAATGSGGIGSGAGAGRSGAGAAAEEELSGGPSGGKLIRKAGTKRCVGSPPRQTEDPLSPPCIAFFDGDNGGATAKGVTKDEVVVTVQMANTSGTQERTRTVDCTQAPTSDDAFEDGACKAFTRYFNDRYQTYGRTVRLISTGRADTGGLRERFGPFANVDNSPSTQWPKAGVLSVAFSGAKRQTYAQYAPLLVSYRPDAEDETAQIGSFVCDKLWGRPARYAGDPTMTSTVRKLGLISYGGTRDTSDRLRADIRDRCGATIAAETAESPLTPAGVASLRAAGVTTVIMNAGNTNHVVATNYATELGWFPEWFAYPGSDLNGIDVNVRGRTANQAQWANAFGITLDVRRAGLAEQPWYRAYREGCPDCQDPALATGSGSVLFVASIYDAISMLFYAIQSAGPQLTPVNIDRGLHAIPPRASDDPFRPAAYFGPGNWSFVKDAMAIWWDPSGAPPGSSTAGCYRLPDGGRRHRPGEWPRGDADLKASGPCQGDTIVG